MLIEILANIGLSMVMFLRGMPNEETINQNIERLKTTTWFKEIYLKNEEVFTKDDHVRYVIGWANVEKSLTNEKRAVTLRKKILDAIKDK